MNCTNINSWLSHQIINYLRTWIETQTLEHKIVNYQTTYVFYLCCANSYLYPSVAGRMIKNNYWRVERWLVVALTVEWAWILFRWLGSFLWSPLLLSSLSPLFLLYFSLGQVWMYDYIFQCLGLVGELILYSALLAIL